MKKIFILAYARQNFGDDIFIKMLLERFTNVNFFIKVPKYEFVKSLDEEYENLNVLIGEDTDTELNKQNEKEYDGYVYIGGSIFMEGGKVYNLSNDFLNFVTRCKNANIPFFYISSNYGPYQTKEYFELSKKEFKTCTDICFRDKYSYNLFKEISNVRYAPDYIFNLKVDNNKKIKNSVGISVISRQNEFNEKYYPFLIRNIQNLLSEGKEIYLFSFCKHEGDEETIEYITKYFNNSQLIHSVKYNGNIDEFLSNYSSVENMITLRFHALILSLLFQQNIVVTSYSKKIDNILEDLDLNLKLINLNEYNGTEKIELSDFIRVSDKKLNKIIIDSKEQDRKLYGFLNNI